MNFILRILVVVGISGLLVIAPSHSLGLPKNLSGPDIISGRQTESQIGEKREGLVIMFLSSLCPCSNSHIIELNSLASKYPNFTFVGVHSNADEPREQARDYFQNVGVKFPVLQDDGAKIADEFKASKTPHAFIVTKNGKIAYQGGVSDSRDFGRSKRKFLRDALEDISSGHEVRVPEGRTLGCAITRRL